MCFTTKTARSAENERVVVAVFVERDGDPQKVLRVVLPLGMQTVHGTRIIVDAEKPIQSAYLFCAADGCVSDYRASPELIETLKKGRASSFRPSTPMAHRCRYPCRSPIWPRRSAPRPAVGMPSTSSNERCSSPCSRSGMTRISRS
ncbi:invasion associated locus B family protein [Bradyrhizobium oligotrophicum S58]